MRSSAPRTRAMLGVSLGALFVLSCLALDPAPLAGQGQLIEGRISFGSRMPPDGQFLVDLQNDNGIVIQTTRTIENRTFRFENVPGGLYYVHIDIEGFDEVRQLVEVAGRTYVDVVLRETGTADSTPERGFAGDAPHVVDIRALGARYPSDAVEEYEKALDDSRKGDVERAIRRLEKAVEAAPDFYQARNNLGILYQREGRFEDAEQQFRRAHDLNRTAAQPLINIGSLWLEQDDFEPASIVLLEAVRLDPLSPAAHYYLGSALYKLARFEEAEEILLRALDLEVSAATRLMLVNVFVQRRDHSGALEQIDRWLEENPDAPERTAVEALRTRIANEPHRRR